MLYVLERDIFFLLTVREDGVLRNVLTEELGVLEHMCVSKRILSSWSQFYKRLAT